MYKGKRYNSILVCLLLVISLVAGTSMGMSFLDNKSEPPVIDTPINESPGAGFVDAENGQTFNGLKKPSNNASAQTRLAYALAVLNYGKGYSSESLYDIDVLGNNQYFYLKRHRGNNYDVVEEWYKMTGALSSVGLHYFTGAVKVPDGKITKMVIRNQDNYSFDRRSYDHTKPDDMYNISYDEYTASKFGVPINEFFAPINPVDSPVIYDNKGRGTNFYEIKVKLNGEKLKPQFLSAFDKFGAVTIDIEHMYCTFKIDKETGFMLSYEVDAMFKAVALGMSGRAHFIITERYQTMNQSAINQIKPIATKFGVEIA